MPALHTYGALRRLIWGGLVAAGLAFVGVTVWGDLRDRDRAVAGALARTADIARALDQGTAQLLGSVDLLLAAAASRVDSQGTGARVRYTESLLGDIGAHAPAVLGLRVRQAGGGSLLYTHGDRANVEPIDAALVQALDRDGAADLAVEAPTWDAGRAAWSVGIGRRIAAPRSRTSLIVTATVSLAALQRLYETLDLGANGSVVLYRSDGQLLARRPYLAANVGRTFPGPVIAAARRAAAGSLETTSIVDGVTRFVSFRRLADYPLVLLVTLARSEVLADWSSDIGRDVALVLGACALLAGLGLALVRALARREQLEAERRATVALLADSEARYRLLAENASDLIVLKPTMRSPRSYVSPAVRRILGWEPEAFAVLPVEAYLHPDELAGLAAAYAGLTPDAPAVTREHRLRHAAGHYVWVESVFQLTDTGPGAQAVVVTARDITARRAADEALRESEGRHRLLADTTGDIIARLDLDGTFRYLSPAATAVVGHAPEAMVGRKATSFIHADDVARELTEFRALVAAGPGARAKFEYRMMHADGRPVWLEVNPTILFDADGTRPLGIIDVGRDISARKAVEAELRAAREQTEQARVEAEAASQAKTDFLATMSHEIRTPLNGILGYTELLLGDGRLGGPEQRHVQRIQSAGSALLGIVNDILDFSEIEAGRVELAPAPFGLAALLDDTHAIVQAAARGKGLDLRIEVEPGLPDRLVGDAGRVRQVLLNLLNNAIKFTPAGRVTLAVARAGAGGEALRFTVADTGIGIAAPALDRLFQRFSQVDGSIRRRFGGTGLGLAISKRFVELMGGRIGVESVPGSGSTFWFSVPLAEAGAAPLAEGAPDAPPPGASASILLVEDVALNRDLAQAILERAGHRVDVAGDGEGALAAVDGRRYDVILMDVQMPGMDGITATRHIRALPSPAAATPIIALSANVLPAQVAAFRSVGMNGHVGKPFRRDELLAAIARHAAPDPGSAAGSDPGPDAPQDVGTVPSTDAASPILDRGVLDDLVGLVGADRVGQLLQDLYRHLQDRFDQDRFDDERDPEDRAHLAAGAHATVSAAGQLGFTQLSELCREIETACATGQGLQDAAVRMRIARNQALAAIVRTRQALRAA